MSPFRATGPQDESQVPDLPDGLTLKYVAEGAANVIWRISLPEETPPPNLVANYSQLTPSTSVTENNATKINGIHDHDSNVDYSKFLLRLRKCLPSSEGNLLAYEYLSTVIMPLMPPGVMVGQSLVRVPPALISRANDILHNLETTGVRPAHRRNLFLAGDPRPGEQQMEEPFAFLLEDMTPDASSGEFLLEFKAKWLAQSPNAPKNWTRCRTCALRLRRYAISTKKGKLTEWQGICPFDLVSKDINRVKIAVKSILRHPRNEDDNLVDRVSKALVDSPQLVILKELQISLDPHGILNADHKSKEFLTAMTLRDCTFYVKVSPTDVQARLGDFDVKSSEGGKGAHWIQVENELINNGWYTGTEVGEFPWKEKGLEVSCTL